MKKFWLKNLRGKTLREKTLRGIIFGLSVGVIFIIAGCSSAGNGVESFGTVSFSEKVYLTEFYSPSERETIIEIYVEDVPGLGESINLNRLGIRSHYRDIDTDSGTVTELSSELHDFQFSEDHYLFEGLFYLLVFSESDSGIVGERIYVKATNENTVRLASMDTNCASFELYIVDDSLRTTLDFVRAGEDCPGGSTNPQYASAGWSAGALGQPLAIPSGTGDRSISRLVAENKFSFEQNRFEEADWRVGERSPALPSDATCVHLNNSDLDKDGIADCLEDGNGDDKFFGMSLYEWGARTNQPDMFLEIDYVSCDVSRDLRTQPRREVLDKIVGKFSNYGYSLHVDVGDLFHSASGTSPANYDLGGGNSYVTNSSDLSNYYGITLYSSGNHIYFNLKEENFSRTRKQLFHYMVMAETSETNGEGGGTAGVAEISGNDAVILLGGTGEGTSDKTRYPCSGALFPDYENFSINAQAYTIMHEFGHNIGLHHGGDEGVNYKPNYASVMNYSYLYFGVPSEMTSNGVTTFTNADSIQKAYYAVAETGGRVVCSGTNGRFPTGEPYSFEIEGAPDEFNLELSTGINAPIDENNLSERDLIYGEPIDYNCDGSFDDEQHVYNINIDVDGNGAQILSTLSDYDDRGNIQTFFYNPPLYLLGLPRAFQNNPPPDNPLNNQKVFSDRQPVVAYQEEKYINFGNFGKEHDHDHDSHDHDSEVSHDGETQPKFFERLIHYGKSFIVWINAFLTRVF